MLRFLVPFLLVLTFSTATRAQLAAEWLRQNQTQRRYLALQISALRQYLTVAQQGYQAVSDGLRTVGQIKRGDLDIHSIFFSSMQRVSPFIQRHRKVIDLAGSYLALIEHCRRMRSRWETIDGLPAWKRGILKDAYLQFADEVVGDMLFLTELITDGRFELNDAERLAQVDGLASRQEQRRARIWRLSGDFWHSATAAARNKRENLHFQNILP